MSELDKKCTKCKQILSVSQFHIKSKQCKDCRKVIQNEFYFRNIEKTREKSKLNARKYRKQKKDLGLPKTGKPYKPLTKQQKDRTNKWWRKRQSSNPLFKMKTATRKMIAYTYNRVKKGEFKKSERTEEILGCTIDFFIKYLESKFYPHPETHEPMTLANHGKNGWHIDHIIAVYRAKTAEELKKLNHYANLQPLWKLDHNKKTQKDRLLNI